MIRLTVTEVRVQLCSRIHEYLYDTDPQAASPASPTDLPAALQYTHTLCGLNQSSVTKDITLTVVLYRDILKAKSLSCERKLAHHTSSSTFIHPLTGFRLTLEKCCWCLLLSSGTWVAFLCTSVCQADTLFRLCWQPACPFNLHSLYFKASDWWFRGKPERLTQAI